MQVPVPNRGSYLVAPCLFFRGQLQGTLHVQKLLMLLPAVREADMVIKSIWRERKGDIHMRNTLFLDMIE